jgi:diaminohydroxyphosphoribosylaminopyrimidine deaminase/5-amino-6-(5-phosphoribosylamino)uracil reductase
VDALLAAGVARVVVGAVDPDERVAGSGIAALQAAGVEVVSGVAAAEVIAADPGYFFHRSNGRPRFRLKLAATLDGQVAAADGTSQWITSPAARLDAHQLRAAADAVVVGAGTLRADDPLLTVRHEDFSGEQPRPVVIAGDAALPVHRRIYERNPLVFVPRAVPLIEGCEIVVAGGKDGRVDLLLAAKEMAARGYLEILVDGGPTLAQALAAAGLVDHFTLYLGAKLAAGEGKPMFPGPFTALSEASPMEIIAVSKVGPDVRIDARPQEGSH